MTDHPQEWNSQLYEHYFRRRRHLLSENSRMRFEIYRNEAEIQLIDGALATLAKYAPGGYLEK